MFWHRHVKSSVDVDQHCLGTIISGIYCTASLPCDAIKPMPFCCSTVLLTYSWLTYHISFLAFQFINKEQCRPVVILVYIIQILEYHYYSFLFSCRYVFFVFFFLIGKYFVSMIYIGACFKCGLWLRDHCGSRVDNIFFHIKVQSKGEILEKDIHCANS